MLEELESLKSDYIGKGGADPTFMDKLINLENYVAYNKKLPQSNTKMHGNSNVNPDVHNISVSQNPGMNPYMGAQGGMPGMPMMGMPPPGTMPPGRGAPMMPGMGGQMPPSGMPGMGPGGGPF